MEASHKCLIDCYNTNNGGLVLLMSRKPIKGQKRHILAFASKTAKKSDYTQKWIKLRVLPNQIFCDTNFNFNTQNSKDSLLNSIWDIYAFTVSGVSFEAQLDALKYCVSPQNNTGVCDNIKTNVQKILFDAETISPVNTVNINTSNNDKNDTKITNDNSVIDEEFEKHMYTEYPDLRQILGNLNDSQKKAVLQTAKYPLTLVQGPPGTGY